MTLHVTQFAEWLNRVQKHKKDKCSEVVLDCLSCLKFYISNTQNLALISYSHEWQKHTIHILQHWWTCSSNVTCHSYYWQWRQSWRYITVPNYSKRQAYRKKDNFIVSRHPDTPLFHSTASQSSKSYNNSLHTSKMSHLRHEYAKFIPAVTHPSILTNYK